MDRDNLLLSVTVAGGAVGFLHAHLPPIYSVQALGTDPELRRTEAQVVGLGLAGAAAVSVAARSWAPLAATALVVGAMLAQYELAGREV